MQVAQLALPLFVQRATSILGAWAADLHRQRTELDEVMCLLEVLQLMQLAPAVADAIIAPDSSLQVTLARPSYTMLSLLLSISTMLKTTASVASEVHTGH